MRKDRLVVMMTVITLPICMLIASVSAENEDNASYIDDNYKRHTALNRVHIEQLNSDDNYVALNHPTFDEEQEQIRTEIFYGDMELLAQLVQAEAGNQDLMGKRLVADVVLNRVDAGFNNQNTIEDVIFYSGAFTSVTDGNFDKAAWNMTEEAYLAAYMEMTGERVDTEIVYFRTGYYSEYGTPAYPYGDHFFSTR